MKYRYTYNFRTVDGRQFQLWDELGKRVSDEDQFKRLCEKDFVYGYLPNTNKKLLMVNMAHVVTLSITVQELP